jgi:hypothetical protein
VFKILSILNSLYIIKRPRALLLRVFEGRGRPIARILKESGRESGEKISEGYGDSLAMAEIRATRQAIEDHYLREVQAVDVPLLSDDLMDIQEPSYFKKS